MQFIQTSEWNSGITALAAHLNDHLALGKEVLWLVGGGSNISASVEVLKLMSEEACKRLTIMMSDERYGEVGHADSNWQQLLNAGFETKSACTFPILTGKVLDVTVAEYVRLFEVEFEKSDMVIAQLGIGPDGHIAGILPNSPASRAENLYIGYQSDPFTRITMTFNALSKVDAAYVMAFGENKLEALTRLRDETVALAQQPAQIVKFLAESYIYNDQIGDKK